jgi:hypothetical protein
MNQRFQNQFLSLIRRHANTINIINNNGRTATTTKRYLTFHSTPANALPMKPGTELKFLAVFKGQDPPKVLERPEYPNWINELAKPLPSLARLRKIPNEEADDKQILRYLKLTRRLAIRQRNEESTA